MKEIRFDIYLTISLNIKNDIAIKYDDIARMEYQGSVKLYSLIMDFNNEINK